MTTEEFRQFICRACGYIYDEALGDPDGGLAAGTRFEAIPDDWMCPTCGVGKADFEPYIRSEARVVSSSSPIAPRGGVLPIVIVGAGTAGWAVAREVRAIDATRPLLMISGCSGCVYAKPMLSVAFAQGRDAASIAGETGLEAARRLGVRLLNETWVSGIDAERRRVRTTRGPIAYANLVLALGAAPAPLPLDEESNRHVWRINHLDHYARFRSTLGISLQHVAVIGAGLVGCELADDLAGAGHRVTLMDIAQTPLPGLAPPEVGNALAAALARGGVAFKAGARVVSIRAENGGYTIALADESLHADLVIAATGLRTEARLARGAGLSFDNGFMVNPRSMRTSTPSIFALGDCASFAGKAYRFIEPIHRQAVVAAAAMLEKESPAFEVRTVPVRLKSRSMPLTLRLAA